MLQKKELSTDKAPSAIGPYSQAIMASGTIYVSGQLPLIRLPDHLQEMILRPRPSSLWRISGLF